MDLQSASIAARSRWIRLGGLLLAGMLSLGQSGWTALPGFAVEDQLDLIQVDRRVIVIDSRNQRQQEFELEVGERVIGLDSSGLVAVARTTARLMGTTTNVQNWQELRYRIDERASPPDRAFLGDRVAMVALQNRLVAMSTTTQSWIELGIGPREPRGRILTGTNLVVAVTGRRVVAFAPKLSSFAEIILTPGESIDSTQIGDNSATLTTPRRILIFRARAGQWTELRRSARGN